MSADLYKLLEEIDKAGMTVMNLFQVRDRTWQANLTIGNRGYSEFACDSDPITALRKCFTIAKKEFNKPGIEVGQEWTAEFPPKTLLATSVVETPWSPPWCEDETYVEDFSDLV